jgi:probable F420-dependent oxidoreductase
MKFGVVFPQTEIGADPAVLRDYTQTAEGLGYDYLLAYDHVLGANPERPGGWRGPYTYRDTFHEILVLFGWMAALTERLEFCAGILILPQRQTALVAKQTAEISVLSGGRLRLGVGIGWNAVEYEALNEDFHNRGKRSEEQIMLLRELWSKPLIKFKSDYHSIPDAGINPLPAQPIPIWFGGESDVVLRRMARLGDGWLVNRMPVNELPAVLDKLHGYIRDAGRDPQQFGIDWRISISRTPPEQWAQEIAQLTQMGVTHVGLNTMGAGYIHPEQHLEVIRRFIHEVGT